MGLKLFWHDFCYIVAKGTNLSSINSMPYPYISDKKKTSEYHLQALTAICGAALNSRYEREYSVMDESYAFFNAQPPSPDKFKYLTETGDGETLPATWMTLNNIRVKLRVLVGELLGRGYDFKVQAINKEAKSRKLEAKEDMRVEMRLQTIASQLEMLTGLPTAKEGPMPQNDQELEEFFKKDYRERAEIILYYALKFLEKRNWWSIERKAAFLDLLITGKCFIKNDIVNGIPVARRVDPRDVFFDRNATDDLLRDATFWGERRYMPLADAAEYYGLTMEELKKCHKDYSAFRNSQNRDRSGLSFSFAPTTEQMPWFQETPSGLRVMVVTAYWQDIKFYNKKVTKDKYGNEHVKSTSSLKAKDGEELIKRELKCWRQASLIGGAILKNWGEMPNQARDRETLHESEPPFVGLIPDYVDGVAVSIVDQVKSLQNLKDIFAYNMQLSVTVSGHKGFIYDVAQCPDDWEPETVIKYLKTSGIAFINSRANGGANTYNQFQTIDMSLSQAVTKYLELIQWCDAQIDAVSGINDARQGVMQGASQAVGTTRTALLQSNMATAPLSSLFDMFSSRVWQQQARLVKIAWADKERFSPIIGDVGFNFLKEDIDLELDDYGVFIEVTPKILDDQATFQQLVMAALQAGKVEFDQVLMLLKETDIMSGIQRFHKMLQQNRELEMQQQMALQQQQAMAQNESQMAMQQFNAQTQAMAQENQKALAQLKAQVDLMKGEQKSKSDKELELIKQRGSLLEKQAEAILGNEVPVV